MISCLKNEKSALWNSLIASQLGELEDILRDAVVSEIESINALSQSIIGAGGKRIRPALLLLGYFSTNGSKETKRVLKIAAAVELLHTASLLHDDVIDEADLRRGKPTANSLFGNKISVLGGDYLLSKVFALVSDNPEDEIVQIVTQVSSKMTQSQVLEVECLGSFELWKANYWRCIEGKTAAFMSACCEIGGILSSADFPQRNALKDYGLQLGLAFQISDDVLDVTGCQNMVGKDLGSDIKYGKYTLPILLCAESNPSIFELLNAENKTVNLQKIMELLKRSGAIEKTKIAAQQHVEKAILALDALSDSEYKKSLVALAKYVVDRNS